MRAIKLVQGDNLPEVTLTLTNRNTGDPLNLSAASTSAVVKFRAVGSTTLLATLPTTKPNGGGDGVIRFSFPGNTLDLPAGNYEGEVEIDYTGQILTVFDTLRFILRAEF